MSAAINRVRAWLARTAVGDVARVHGAPAVAVDTGDVAALLADYDAQRTRAEAAEAEVARLRAAAVTAEAAFRAGTAAAAAWLDARSAALREMADHTETSPPEGCPEDIAERLVEDGRDSATQYMLDARYIRSLPLPGSMSAEAREVERAYRVEVERWAEQAEERRQLARANGLRWRGERDSLRGDVARLRAAHKAAVDALRAEERDVTGVDPYSEGGRYALGYRDGVRRALAAWPVIE